MQLLALLMKHSLYSEYTIIIVITIRYNDEWRLNLQVNNVNCTLLRVALKACLLYLELEDSEMRHQQLLLSPRHLQVTCLPLTKLRMPQLAATATVITIYM